jgi:adenine-specific DNA-methyltransferase
VSTPGIGKPRIGKPRLHRPGRGAILGSGEGSTNRAASPAAFSLHNRKYLGAKHRLLDFIHETVLSRVDAPRVFIDGFAGTGVVGLHFRACAGRIVSNDLLYSNFVVNQAFLNSTPANADLGRVRELLEGLNRLPPRRGYVYRQYGGRYFTARNAGRIDAVREAIEELAAQGRCTTQERFLLLASLLYAADKAANTVGQYDAFLKHLGGGAAAGLGSGSAGAGPRAGARLRGGADLRPGRGRHLVDSNVHKPLRLRMPDVELGEGGHEVYNEDLNRIIGRLAGEVLYLDPPYNGRQYIDCYHVLENILRWQRPPLYGKTRKFARGPLKSRYSRRQEAAQALAELIGAAGSPHIFLSYNSEGIIPEWDIAAILARKGRWEVFEREYAVFGNGAGSARRRAVRERIFYCRAGKA